LSLSINYYYSYYYKLLPDDRGAGEQHTEAERGEPNTSLCGRWSTCYQLKQALVFIIKKSVTQTT